MCNYIREACGTTALSFSNPGRLLKYLLAPISGPEGGTDAVHICVAALNATPVSRVSDLLPCRFITTVEIDFVEQLLCRRKKLRFFSLLKKLLMFVGAI